MVFRRVRRKLTIDGNMVTLICEYINGMRGVHWLCLHRVNLVEKWIFVRYFCGLLCSRNIRQAANFFMLWWDWFERLKWSATGFDTSVSFFSTSRWWFAKAVRQSSPCFVCVDLLYAWCACYAMDDIYGDARRVVSDFSGSIWSWDLKINLFTNSCHHAQHFH